MQKSSFYLGPNWRLVTITGVMVVGLHLAVLLLVDLRMGYVPKRPGIDIEFTSPKPVPSNTQAPPAPVALPARVVQRSPEVPIAPKAPSRQPAEAAPMVPSEPTPAPAPAEPARAPTSGQADVLPSADADYKAAELNNPKPLYPLTAVRQEAQGRVLLLVEVLADGRVGRVTLEKTSGHAILDASAMKTVRLWQFKPAVKDGVFYAQTIRVPIDFNLTGSR